MSCSKIVALAWLGIWQCTLSIFNAYHRLVSHVAMTSVTFTIFYQKWLAYCHDLVAALNFWICACPACCTWRSSWASCVGFDPRFVHWRRDFIPVCSPSRFFSPADIIGHQIVPALSLPHPFGLGTLEAFCWSPWIAPPMAELAALGEVLAPFDVAIVGAESSRSWGIACRHWRAANRLWRSAA